MANLLNVDDALRAILDRIQALPAETIPTTQGLKRVLAEAITAETDLPPFASSSMDGYAVRYSDAAAAHADQPVQLTVIEDIPAGRVAAYPVGPMQAARIMTGAPLPDGADAVIPVEETDDEWLADGGAAPPEKVSIYRAARPGENVRPIGEDVHHGQMILQAGTVLRPQDIGMLISLGRAEILVIRQPRVVILSTGDELVDVGEPLGPGKIYNSNSYVLEGLITMLGGIAIRLPTARDTLDDVRRCLAEALAQQPDLIVSSAGVSVGVHDVVRTVVEELGHVELWRVNLRPGKPLAFGQVQQIPFFGLPGNPVSAMVTFDVFVRPTLLQMSGQPAKSTPPMTAAVVGEALRSDGRRSYLRVKLRDENGQLVAYLTGTQSSGALLSMVLADGLLIVPEGMTHVPAGTKLPVRVL
ncbi:MAG TPA: gephyrin-like molybdotransferase Glp [Aggregatilineaceae bacterium]|nr:gephyrin-like molybdotransferase Glp [Aggregatilineaceae bacterium]